MPTNQTQLQQKETQTADNPSVTSKTLVRTLLGLPERQQMGVISHAPVPPVEFRYETASGDRKIISASQTFNTADDTYGKARQQQEQQGESIAVFKDYNPASLHPHAEHKEDSAQPYFKAEEKPTENRHVSHETENRGIEPPARSMQQRVENSKKNLSGIQTGTVGKTADRSTVPGQKKTARTTSKDKDSPPVQQEIEVPGVSEEKQVFPSLADTTHVDLMAGSKKQKTATVHIDQDRRQAETTPSLTEANYPVSVPTASREMNKQQPKPDKPPLPEQSKKETATSKVRNLSTVQHEFQVPGNANNADDAVIHRKPTDVAGAQKQSQIALTNPAQDPSAAAKIHQDKTSPAIFTPQGAPLEGTDKIDQLRRSFHELMTKKLAEQKKLNDQTPVSEPFPSQEENHQQQPVIQQVVVVQRSGVARGKRQPAAYWERSYTGRSWMNMVR